MALTTTYPNPNQTLASGGLEGATNDVISATFWNRLASMVHFLGGTTGSISCEVSQSGATSVTNNQLGYQVAMPTEITDSDPNGAMHDIVTFNSRITVRTAGFYVATAYIAFAANSSGLRKANIRVNGATDIAGASVAAVSGLATEFSLAKGKLFAVNDYIELTCFQNSGGALNLDFASMSLQKA